MTDEPSAGQVDEVRALDRARLANAFSGASLTAQIRAVRMRDLLDEIAAHPTASATIVALVEAWQADQNDFSQRAAARAEWAWGPAFDLTVTSH